MASARRLVSGFYLVSRLQNELDWAIARAGELADDEQPTDLAPPLDDQLLALEHIEKAILLLQPPKQDDQQKNQDGGDQDQDQDQDQNQDQDQDQNQDQNQDGKQGEQRPQAGSDLDDRLRALRENEANRRRDRERKPRTGGVEKDW